MMVIKSKTIHPFFLFYFKIITFVCGEHYEKYNNKTRTICTGKYMIKGGVLMSKLEIILIF